MTTLADGATAMGAQIRRYDGSWQEIVGVRSVWGPSMTRDTVDTTLLNASGGYKTFLPTFRDGGSIPLVVRFDRTGYEEMKADFDSDALVNYELCLPDSDATTIEFEGCLTELGLPIEITSVMELNMTIKISGNPTVNSGSASATPS